MLRMILDKFEGDSKAVHDDLVTKLNQASDAKITDRRVVDFFNYMHSVHELVIELLRLKVSPELIEDYAKVPVQAVLESAQDCNDVMDQLQWRAIGNEVAKFVKIRNSKTVAIHKCTWETVFDDITTMYAKKVTKANAQKINYKPESGRVHIPVGVGFAGIELPAIENIAFGDMTPDEVGNMLDHDYLRSIVAAVTSKPASIEDFKTLYNGRRPQGGPGLLFPK